MSLNGRSEQGPQLKASKGLAYLDMLLQILRTLEALSTEVALVRLEWDVNADMRGDMVALDGRGAAHIPSAGQVQVVCALASDMALADMVIEGLGGLAAFGTFVPLTSEVIIVGDILASGLGLGACIRCRGPGCSRRNANGGCLCLLVLGRHGVAAKRQVGEEEEAGRSGGGEEGGGRGGQNGGRGSRRR
jgi:hypothetical protein